MPEKEVAYMNITEFRTKGYLQEINRLFLHPLGLALEMHMDDDGREKISGIWDYRNQPEGVRYSDEFPTNENLAKATFIENEWEKKAKDRKKILGYIIQPLT